MHSPDLDPVDTLLLDTAAEAIAAAGAGEVVVVGDPTTTLALELAATTPAAIRVHQDSLIHERALAAAALDGVDLKSVDAHPLVPALVAGASVVLVRLPRSLDALRAIVELIADHAAPDVTVVAAGRIKHMAIAMNDVLRMRFDRVDVTHARQKSRALVARGPKAGARFEPITSRVHELPGVGAVTICAAGGAFAGTGVDIGTRFLIEQLAEAKLDTSAAIDFACGTGLVAAWLALRDPQARVLATDVSAVAVVSARATVTANGVSDRVEVVQDVGLASRADASASLIVLNPPFHEGAAINKDLAPELFADAARVLSPGGELWTVWNSHLQYRGALERIVGPTEQVARNAKFTVARSVKR
jgi:16S rRNA (guanine1207-N2)-methyltransferase